MSLAFDWLLAGLLVALALGAVVARAHWPAVALFITYGLLLAIGWVRLEAVDVALAEAAIGAGITGVLLIAALRAEPDLAPPPRILPVAAAGLVAAALLWAIADLTEPPAGLREAAEPLMARAGADNPVTAVLLSFRGWDTLLETVVIALALVAVWALGPDRDWGGRPDLAQAVRPAGVLATFGRFLPPLALVVGVYLVWTGASAPGGAFQGGTVLAAAWLLVLMAGLVQPPMLARGWVRWLVVGGPLLFLGAGALGLLAGAFLRWPDGFEKPVVLAIELALAASIAATLALLVLGPARRA